MAMHCSDEMIFVILICVSLMMMMMMMMMSTVVLSLGLVYAWPTAVVCYSMAVNCDFCEMPVSRES
jgi:hypothetical protein